LSTAATPIELPSRWPHRVAVLLALVVFPLIWVGGLVTTYDAGMAVPDWPGTYGYNMFLYPIETWLFGPFDLLVEHGHRLLGSLAGMIAIVLVAVTLMCETRKSVRWLAVAILLLVIAQGVLGGVRVLLDARSVAKIHGCLGPAFFATVVGFCVVTSRWWIRTGEQVQSGTLRRNATSTLTTIALLMLIVSFGQLVIGAFLRHIAVDASPVQFKILILLHIITAVVIAFGTFWQWIFSRKSCFQSAGIRGSINWLLLLISLQILLGIGTWVVKFGWPVWFENLNFAASFVIGEKTFLQMNLITAHVAVGSLILAMWVVHLLRCHQAIGGNKILNLQSKSSSQPGRPREPLTSAHSATTPF
jgi:cytochrome c oxidase assembly protein subunit 15